MFLLVDRDAASRKRSVLPATENVTIAVTRRARIAKLRIVTVKLRYRLFVHDKVCACSKPEEVAPDWRQNVAKPASRKKHAKNGNPPHEFGDSCSHRSASRFRKDSIAKRKL
jgi:hypothetical protein